MSYSAAAFYEVRWRVKNADEKWSSPRRCNPVGEIVVEELDRNKQYEFEVRAVSECGAKSDWVGSDYTVPGAVPPTSVDTLTAQSLADGVHLGWTSIAIPAAGIESSIERSPDGSTGWVERARVRSTAYTDPEPSATTYFYRVRYVNFAGQFGGYSPVVSSNGVNVGDIGTNAANALADAAAAQADANAALLELGNIASDNLLSQGEKPLVIRDNSVIVAEQSGIDAQATAFAITTEKSAYDSAVSALTSYLATLTTPTLWSDLAGDTTIVGTTFRSKFSDVYTTRQTLLNAIYAAAKSKADAAQTTGNTANSIATQVAVINGGFDATPYGTGWTMDNGWVVKSDGAGPGVGIGYAQFNPTGINAAIYNSGRVGVLTEQTYKTQALIKAAGANGSAYVRISWRNAAGTEVGHKNGNVITGTVTTGSYAVGQAPAGAVYAATSIEVDACSTGSYQVDNVVAMLMPSTLDEVPDSSSRFGAIYTPNIQNGIYQPGGNLLRNPTAALGNLYWPNVIGAGLLTRPANFFTGSAASSDPCWQASATGADQGQQTDPIAIPAGTPLVLSADMLVIGVTGTINVYLAFFNSSGVEITPRQSITAVGGSAAPWVTYSLSYTTPAGCATVQVFPRGNPSSGTALWRRIKLEVGTVATPFNDLATQSGNQLVNPGSGYVLGNQLNAPNSLTLNYGAARTATAVTASSSGAVSVNAFAVNMGGTTVSYNAVSNAVTGLTVGTTYQIYCHDPGGTGGTKTWYAVAGTANALLTLGDDVVLGGQVTIPSTGSSGGGAAGGCPVVDAWVVTRLGNARAGDVRVGDELLLVDGRWGFVSHSRCKSMPCVVIRDEKGKTLTCSTTAPLGRADGGSVLAPDAKGCMVVTDRGHARITDVSSAGTREVQHITCEDDFFWAGDDPDYLFSHHNMKP